MTSMVHDCRNGSFRSGVQQARQTVRNIVTSTTFLAFMLLSAPGFAVVVRLLP